MVTFPPQWFTSDRKLQIMSPLFQYSTARQGDLFTASILHFTGLLSAAVAEIGAAPTVLKLNVYPGLFFNGQDMCTVNCAISTQ